MEKSPVLKSFLLWKHQPVFLQVNYFAWINLLTPLKIFSGSMIYLLVRTITERFRPDNEVTSHWTCLQWMCWWMKDRWVYIVKLTHSESADESLPGTEREGVSHWGEGVTLRNHTWCTTTGQVNSRQVDSDNNREMQLSRVLYREKIFKKYSRVFLVFFRPTIQPASH